MDGAAKKWYNGNIKSIEKPKREGLFMIELDGMVSIPYLKKTVFTGSFQGMRYQIKKISGEDGDKIQAAAWPGPYIFSVTEDEKKTFREFPFSGEGLLESIDWLNQHYEESFGKK